MEGVKTATYLNCSILAYHKGCLFYSARFIDDENMINYKLIRTDHQGNQYIYQLQDHVYCISADGLLAKADEEENCILIENPLDGSVQAFCIPGLTIIRCLAWYDLETLLFMFKEEGELMLGMLNKNSGAYGKVMTSNEKEIKLDGSFHGMMDIDAESNLFALIYPSGDESEYYAFPMLLDLDTGKRFILSYPMEYGNAESEVISRGNRVMFLN